MTKLIQLIQQAGAIALKEQENMVFKEKADGTIVTNGDLAVSEFLEKNLPLLFPDFEVFSEENLTKQPQSNKIIVIDPIDGTKSYSRKENMWTILIGFLENGQITQGVIYQPTSELLFHAKRNEGAFLQKGHEIIKMNSDRLGKLKACSSHKREGEVEFLNRLGIEEIDFMYSAALKIMKVAMGECDIYPNFQQSCSIWDLIAPTIILQEAGGEMVYQKDIPLNFVNPLVNTRFCAVGPRLKEKIIQPSDFAELIQG